MPEGWHDLEPSPARCGLEHWSGFRVLAYEPKGLEVSWQVGSAEVDGQEKLKEAPEQGELILVDRSSVLGELVEPEELGLAPVLLGLPREPMSEAPLP